MLSYTKSSNNVGLDFGSCGRHYAVAKVLCTSILYMSGTYTGRLREFLHKRVKAGSPASPANRVIRCLLVALPNTALAACHRWRSLTGASLQAISCASTSKAT